MCSALKFYLSVLSAVYSIQTGFRYTNIGGNFFTGIDLTSEVKAQPL